MFRVPSTVLVYGPSRPLVNLVLFALARNTNPDFQWVDVAGPRGERAPCDPVRLGWIPDDRLWRVDHPDSLRPSDPPPDRSLFSVIRPDESPQDLDQVAGFLALSDTSQRILTGTPPGGRPGVVVVADAHLFGRDFAAGQVSSVLDVHRNSGYSLLVGYPGEAGRGRDLFDYVFRLQGKDERRADWEGNQLVSEKGVTSGPLGKLRPVRLREIPLLAEVIARARASPWPGEPNGPS